MLHHLARATIQIANLVNYNCYNCHPLEDGNHDFCFQILAHLAKVSNRCSDETAHPQV